jgi:cytochrome c oxidase assembly protein subunit 15
MPDPATALPTARPGAAAEPQIAPAARIRLRAAASCFALVGLTYLLITIGALVRAHDAGLACPDWPLCFGEFVPQMNLEVTFEWTHRLVAGSVALLFSGLAIGLLRNPETPAASRQLLGLATGLLATQILLGALTVWLKLASWTVTAHLITGNSFCVTLLLIGCSLRDSVHGRAARPAAASKARAAVLVCVVLLFAQMLLGGLVSSRYAGLVCTEWPACNGGVWFPTWQGNVGLHLLHRLNGYALIAAFAWALSAARGDSALYRLLGLLLAIGLAQIVVGVANVTLGLPQEITGLHTALAAALVLTLTLAVRDLYTRSALPRRTQHSAAWRPGEQ